MGHDPPLQGLKEGVQLGDAQALLAVVQAGVVGAGVALVPQGDLFAPKVDHRLQGVPEQGEIAGLFGPEPVGIGPVGGPVVLVGEAGRDVFGLPVVVVQVLHGFLLDFRQALAVPVELAEQLRIALGVGQAVQVLAEQGHVLPRLVQAVLRGAAALVKAHLAQAAAVGFDLV